MNSVFLALSILLFCSITAPMENDQESLKTRKLFAQDFKLLGVEYLSHSIPRNDEHWQETISENNPSYYVPPLPEVDEYVKNNADILEKKISEGYQAPMYLKFINEIVGFGVFALKDIENNEFVGEYTGRLLTFSEAYKLSLTESGYFMGLRMRFANVVIDAKKSGNFARFFNHSYKPNVGVCGYNLNHTIFITEKRIKKDEQLFINYGDAYWSPRTKPLELNGSTCNSSEVETAQWLTVLNAIKNNNIVKKYKENNK
jgi:hypothetical protein